MLKTENEEKSRFPRPQRRWADYGQRFAETSVSKNHPLKNRIRELEEENAKLRSTIQFFQDLHLRDD